MRWTAAVSQEPLASEAVRAAASACRAGLAGAEPDLLLAFASAQHAPAYAALAELLAEAFPRAVVVGCSARSVLGAGREVEEGPGLALAAATLPGVEVRPLRLPAAPAPETPELWRGALGLAPDAEPGFVLLADPFGVDAESLVRGLDAAFPASVKVGGLASAADAPGGNALWLDGELARAGVVGVALSGDVVLEAVVAQGCRPVGNPMFVTRCRDEWILELDGRPPADVLGELYAAAAPRDRELFGHSLFLGIEMTPLRSEYRRGDFLIRNLVGGDSESGALAVAASPREAQVVQFHLRDGRTAAEDLEERLARVSRAPRPRGALLFSCLGRGRQLYGVPDHDSRALARHLGDVALAGFFCNGEIGPVEERTFLHGYTSAFGLFRPRTSA